MVPGYHDRMIVSWVSNSTDGSPLVVWGVAADALNESAPATHDTYTAADFTNCMGIAAINTLAHSHAHARVAALTLQGTHTYSEIPSHSVRIGASPRPTRTATGTRELGPGADVGGVSPVPVQMWEG